jgi:hypothetical protein
MATTRGIDHSATHTREVIVARSRTQDEERAPRRDGPAGAGAASAREVRNAEGKRQSGYQAASTRPTVKTGEARRAPKKGEVPPKGTRQPGAQKKTRSEK